MPSARTRSTTKALQLRLYVAGNGPNSTTAAANIRSICELHFPDKHELEIVDMLWHPQRAMADEIIVTPTLLRLGPLPTQRVIGNLSDTAKVLLALGAE